MGIASDFVLIVIAGPPGRPLGLASLAAVFTPASANSCRLRQLLPGEEPRRVCCKERQADFCR